MLVERTVFPRKAGVFWATTSPLYSLPLGRRGCLGYSEEVAVVADGLCSAPCRPHQHGGATHGLESTPGPVSARTAQIDGITRVRLFTA